MFPTHACMLIDTLESRCMVAGGEHTKGAAIVLNQKRIFELMLRHLVLRVKQLGLQTMTTNVCFVLSTSQRHAMQQICLLLATPPWLHRLRYE